MPSRNRQSSDYGHERARQHIADARRLTAELGGTDEDVKKYFFALTAAQLRPILDEYKRLHGRDAGDYAETTLPRWRSGATQMAGQTAERLFKLLPAYMPIVEKYKLTQNLWQHVGPSSRKAMRIGPDATVDEIMAKVEAYLNQMVASYVIPDAMERRFNWLTAGDIHAKQDLLNHFRGAERTLVLDAARLQVPVMLNHAFGPDHALIQRFAETFNVGKHELRLYADPQAFGIELEEWSVSTKRRAVSDIDPAGVVTVALVISLIIAAIVIASSSP